VAHRVTVDWNGPFHDVFRDAFLPSEPILFFSQLNAPFPRVKLKGWGQEPCRAFDSPTQPHPQVLVYATSGQERFAALGVLNGPIIRLAASLKTYPPQSYCWGHFLTQRTRHCRATLQPRYCFPFMASHQPGPRLEPKRRGSQRFQTIRPGL
jgi:hypothetical protein